MQAHVNSEPRRGNLPGLFYAREVAKMSIFSKDRPVVLAEVEVKGVCCEAKQVAISVESGLLTLEVDDKIIRFRAADLQNAINDAHQAARTRS